MTGLEKIIKHIDNEADLAAESIIKKAKIQAEDIISDIKAQCKKKIDEVLAQSAIDVKSAISRAESTALLQEKRLLLDVKQKLISEIIEKAKQKLIALTDREYFDVIIQMVKKYASQEKGRILFSEADKKRLPNQFQDEVSKALSGKTGAELTIPDETRKINGGFVLLYGEVEENCSFDALFFADRESLQDKVSNVIFN